jgi:hypothetical protein
MNSPSSFLVKSMVSIALLLPICTYAEFWESKFLKVNSDNSISYARDERGNTIPDFSRVGYHQGDSSIPDVAIVKSITPSGSNDGELIQSAVHEMAQKPPDSWGFRGAILLKKGTYKISGTIHVHTSGIVLRGEGDNPDGSGTKLIATGKEKRTLIKVEGSGTHEEIPDSRVKITDEYVPVGAFSFHVGSAKNFKVGDAIVVYRPGTEKWIKDLKMDKIEPRNDSKNPTQQWNHERFHLSFERTITKIDGNEVFIDNPVVMAMESQYGGGEIFKYTFKGRLNHIGVENIYFESEFAHETDEDHAWNAIALNIVENSWVRNVTAKHFGFSCVNLGRMSKSITVTDSRCEEAKSMVTGGRRYSFNNDGQLNLVMNCHTKDGRHDFATGAFVCGPNVFYNCTATRTHNDIGPHHRWASGTLYDNITTDGPINVQDRGNFGTGHGWAGVTQVLWNCTAKKAIVQSPWVSGKNYCIGLLGIKDRGRHPDRPEGEWEGHNQKDLVPKSLYLAQLRARQR